MGPQSELPGFACLRTGRVLRVGQASQPALAAKFKGFRPLQVRLSSGTATGDDRCRPRREDGRARCWPPAANRKIEGGAQQVVSTPVAGWALRVGRGESDERL